MGDENTWTAGGRLEKISYGELRYRGI